MVLVVNVVGLLLVFAGGVILVVGLQRGVVHPITQLAAQVRGAAAGSRAAVITATGAPELRLLADDVEAMRRQIAADLAEVEHARQQLEQAHAQLERQAAELVRSNQDLEQFAYIASHDLREPLRKVASFCELLQRRYADQLDERANQYIAYAVAGARRMQRLIDGLLEFSRLGRSGGPTAFGDAGEAGVRVDLDRVVASQVSHLDLGTGSERAEVTWSALPLVRGNEELLGRLMANVISNGVKFRRPGVPARVHVSARRSGAFWEVSCVDNGIGIASDQAEEAFVLFRRLREPGTYPGTGMGLAIAKRIVEHYGGTIWMDATVTSGTAVRFTLPIFSTLIGQTVNDPVGRASAAPTAVATASANRSTSD
jgi:light-regulated signal transduction histidine kinase (bacteriophytochrome)